MDYSFITPDLFIGTTPATQDYDHLRELGVKLVINMRVEYRPRKDLHPTPMQLLWLPTFDSPLIPISLKALPAVDINHNHHANSLLPHQ